MAKYTPTGWKMSREGAAKFTAMMDKINLIVKKRTRKYNLSALDLDDLMQEGRLAAAYAVDSYHPSRGNLDGYISTVVSNALAMVAAEALAQSRQPYKNIQNADGSWRRTPATHVELEHETAFDLSQEDRHERRCRAQSMVERTAALDAKLDGLGLSPDAQLLLELRMRTPAELLVLARNINRGRFRLEANCVCSYLGWLTASGCVDRNRYQRACHEVRDQFRFVLGINDQSFEPIAMAPMKIPTLFKQRPLEAVRA